MNTTLERTISIAQAAELLRVKLPVLDKLLREDAICTLYGERGKGGRLRLSLSDLPIIEAAYKLIELKVPRPAVRDLSGRASVMLQEHPDSNIFLSYHKDANIVVIAPEIAQMTKIIRDGVSAVFINARRADELSHDADMLSAPRLRGRPKIDRAYVTGKLDSSADLGDDDIEDVAAEIRRLSGE